MTCHTRPLALGLAALLHAACAATPAVSNTPDLDGTMWTMSSLSGHTLVTGSGITLRFEGGRVQGSDGCNRYSASYTVSGSTLKIGPDAVSTQMACQAELMQQADAYMSALTRTQTFRTDGGQLQLLGADGGVLAAFAAQSQALAGTSWRVTGYNNGKQAVVSVLAETTLTMAFSTDGSVSGAAGCNRYSAAYQSNGMQLSLTPAATTRKMCAQPDGIMEQEQRFLAALEMVGTLRFEADRLELRSADGALALTLVKN